MIDQHTRDLVAICLCVPLAAFLVWREIKRQNKHNLILRVVGSIAAVTSLLFLSSPVWYHSYRIVSNDAILITEDAVADSVAAFTKAVKKDLPMITLDAALAKKYNATYIADPNDILSRHYRTMHVFGNGIKTERLKTQAISFHPSPLPTAIVSAHWKPLLYSGEKLVVEGTIHNTKQTPAKLILSSYGQLMDSVSVPANGDHSFALNADAKQLGRNIYSLALINKNDTLEKEPVPVNVVQSSPVKILMLSASPDFETRFLKNWLAEKGYEVMVRTTISKNKTGKEFLNTTAVNLDQISNELLNRCELVIADATAIAALTTDEQQHLRGLVSAAGKGLIVKADSALPRNVFFNGLFSFAQADTGLQHGTALQLTNGDTIYHPLASAVNFYMRPQTATQTLVSDHSSHILVSSVLFGAGKLVLTTMPDTYSYILSGNTADYNTIWSAIINKALPGKKNNESWTYAPSWPRVNQPVRISLNADSVVAPVGQLNNTTVYLAPSEQSSTSWSGIFWPQKAGWQTGITLNGSNFYWYVYDTNDWKWIAALQQQRVSELQSRMVQPVNEAKESTGEGTRKDAPKIFFFLLFLFSCAYLWFENKYYDR